VLIAHALARHPELLLLDEPLANLDLPSTQETVRLLGRIAREQRVAILLSTHDVNPLLPVMDRVIYLAAGRAASGKTDEVIRSDVLSELYGRHVDVFHAHGRLLVSVGEEHRDDGCEVEHITANDCDEEAAAAGPMLAGPMVAGPMVAGPRVTGPTVTGPMVTGATAANQGP
jgi:zinc/manganese transport system ATP-binding protein